MNGAIWRMVLAVGLVAFGPVVWALSGSAPSSNASTLAELVRDSGLLSAPVAGVGYRMVVEGGGETSTLVVREEEMGWEDAEGRAVKAVYLYSEVLAVPEGYQHPRAMLKQIAELNDSLLFGNLSVNPQSGSIYYNDAFWLRTADVEVLRDEAYLAHFTRLDLRKELRPYLEEG